MKITNTLELRSSILDDLAALQDGRLSAGEARIRASMARQVIDLVKIELLASDGKGDTVHPVDLRAPLRLNAPASENVVGIAPRMVGGIRR